MLESYSVLKKEIYCKNPPGAFEIPSNSRRTANKGLRAYNWWEEELACIMRCSNCCYKTNRRAVVYVEPPVDPRTNTANDCWKLT